MALLAWSEPMKTDLLFFSLIMVLAGCTSGLPVTGTSAPAYTVSPSPSATYTPTVSPLKTPSILPDARMEVQCLDILPTLPPNLKSEGILVLRDEFSTDTFLMDLATGQTNKLSQAGEYFPEFYVSPNHNWMAYVDWKNPPSDNLWYVANVEGQVSKIVPDSYLWDLVGWLDNEQLVVRLDTFIPTSEPSSMPSLDMTEVPTLLILNPFTGERRILEPDIPDLVPWGGKIPWWDGWSGLVYDPTLKYAAYLGKDGLTLRDLENAHTIASVLLDIYSRPFWSPDGERFAVADSLDYSKSAYEIYVMSLNGKVLQLSNLSAYHLSNYISGLTWSPDGRYLAFWLSSWDEEVEYYFYNTLINPPASLAVLDTASGKIINYCIQGDSREFVTPLWSPDGLQIVILEDQDTDSVDYDRVILIDLELGLAAQIAENMIPVGWLREP